jgi:esterase/lipase superfamily enzyme
MPCVYYRGLAIVLLCTPIAACAGPRAHDMLLPYTAAAAQSDLAGTHEIFVATTRARAKDVAQIFDGQRSPDLSLARIKVTVPAAHEAGKVERPKGRVANPSKYFAASDLVAYADDAAFVSALRTDLARHGHRALVFVHGYNNLFDDAVYRTTQIVHDAGYDGTPVLFSWASGGRTVDYVYDRDSATAARDRLEETLRLLLKAGAKRIDVIAHSMGNLLTVEALRQMAIAGDRDLDGRLGDVILASPDIDIDVFKAQMKRYGKPDRPFILMLSRDDRALDISRIIGGDRPRLGGYDNTQEIAELGLTVIDLTQVSAGDSLNHAKFADNPVMVKLIGEGLKNPELRGDPANAEGTLTQLGRGLGNTLGQTITIAVTLPGRIIDVTLGQ